MNLQIFIIAAIDRELTLNSQTELHNAQAFQVSAGGEYLFTNPMLFDQFKADVKVEDFLVVQGVVSAVELNCLNEKAKHVKTDSHGQFYYIF